jgi:HSP20 family protein
MQLTRWNPFQEMEDIFGSFPRLGRLLPARGEPQAETWSPTVDITEDAKEYLVKAELPGVKKEDVKVSVDNGILMVSGERKFEKEEKDAKFHRIERSYGSFERSFSVPDDVLADKIGADYKDGMVYIHLPKTDIRKSQAKQIKVQ